MKILFFPVYMVTPHFETELELMKSHLLKGDEIFAVHCQGELSTCFYNAEHLEYKCTLCKSTFNYGISLLENINIINIPFAQEKYPEIPPIFKDVEELKQFKIGNIELGLCAASSLITRLNYDHRFDTVKHQETVFKEVNNAYYVYKFFKQVLQKIQPEIVYLFNGRFSTVLPAINACEELKIPFASHERGGQINKYYLANNTLPHDAEHAYNDMERLWAQTDEQDRIKYGDRFYIDRRKGVTHNWYSFIEEQQQNRLPLSFDKKKKNIVFFNSTIEEFAAIRGWNNPINIYGEEIVAFRQILKAFQDDSRFHFYIRIHPNLKGINNSQVREATDLEKTFSNVTVIAPDSPIDSYALMESCDKSITFLSTMGAEACYWGKPCILLGKSFYEKLDCCYIPSSHQETINLIRSDLLPKNKLGAIKYGLWMLNMGTEFKYYKQTGIKRGKFLGKKISYTKYSALKAACSYLFSVKKLNEFSRLCKIGFDYILNSK